MVTHELGHTTGLGAFQQEVAAVSVTATTEGVDTALTSGKLVSQTHITKYAAMSNIEDLYL